MDTAGVIRRVQRIFGDSNEIQISKADIIDWINDGLLKLVRETECHIETQLYSTGTSPIDYSTGFLLPDNFIAMKRVLFNNQAALKEIPIEELDSQRFLIPDTDVTTTEPTHYYLEGFRVYVWPTPAVVGPDILSMTFIAKLDDIVDENDVLGIPVSLHEDLVRYALMRAHERNENYVAANKVEGELVASLATSRDEQQRRVDSYPVVRDDPVDLW